MDSNGLTRRELFLMGNALAVPTLLGRLDASLEAAAVAGPLVAGPQIYQSLGVEPVINCRGTFTIIGGSVERPEVRAAMDAAAKHFVQIDELADAVGRRFAELTGAEWGMVSAGCAAGLKHITVACVTGGNPEKLIRIPDLSGLDKTEVIVPRSSRSVYDHAIRNVGVRMVTVESIEEIDRAINPRTAMIYLMADSGPNSMLEPVARVAGPKNIPILVDAAAEVLTIPNVHLQRGATVVAYSGGKAICGPQCAGLLLGRKDILQSAWQASAPHHGPGRDNKVGREETLGMLAAVEAWVKRDHAAEWKTWLGWLDTISKRVMTIDGVKTAVLDVDVEFYSSRSQHTLQIEQDGNWIQGSHRGDFSTRELVGMIEGDKVTLRSVDQRPGDSITFIFAGTLANGTISGPIHLGEYLTARFTARRHAYTTAHTRIRVPSGPPLAT
jgi:seryl-tRNA(Sec) selenium transferase